MQATVHERAVHFPPADATVIADPHVGRAAASKVELPLGERADLTDRLDAVLGAFDPAELVVAGDVVHRFGGPDRRARETLRALTDACRAAGTRPVLVAGNHDAALDRAWDGAILDHYRLDPVDGAGRVDVDAGGDADAAAFPDTVVHHGHELPAVDADRYVVGHDHPVIEVEGKRRPCVLRGPDQRDGAEVVMLPTFTRLAAGTVVNGMTAADFQSPLITDADALRPLVRDAEAGETLRFPPLGEFRSLL
ncbi:MAG: metallophosphoesterase [Halolamina sp.]